MTSLVAFSNAGLPAVSSLTSALRAIAPAGGSGMTAILKMDRTGHWVFGTDQEEVEDTSRWAVNPFSFVHGFIAWGEGEVLAEKMGPITQPVPEIGPAPSAARKGWEPQVGFSLQCISGEDSGMDVRYTVTSVGGKRAVHELAVAIAAQVEKDQTRPVPVVTLGKDHYQHKQYGRIFTPVFVVKEWVSMDAEPAADAGPAPADEPAAPGRRRRSV
jgi:hypothetical protein